MRACEQKICDLRGTGKCPHCRSCNASPDIVDDNCEICYCCEREQNFVRGNDKKDEITTKIMIIAEEKQ